MADRVVLMNAGNIEQVGSPQEVWDHPASPFVYGFLGDVNLFHGRAHEGEVHFEGMQMASPELVPRRTRRPPPTCGRTTWTCSATRRRQRHPGQAVAGHRGRPIARLELLPLDGAKQADNAGSDPVIEAQIPAQQFQMGFREGDTLVATPRRARVFLESGAGI